MNSDVSALFQQVKSQLQQNEMIRSRGWEDHEARQILAHALEMDHAQLILTDSEVDPGVREASLRLAERRRNGEPLQYLLGTAQFLNCVLRVGPGVLIPRPETEGLAVLALEHLKGLGRPTSLLEVGVGSGAITLSLATQVSDLKVVATEVSGAALAQAQQNARDLMGSEDALQRVLWIKVDCATDVLTGVMERRLGAFDLIISNPPYLCATDEIDQDVLQFEPRDALFAPATDPLFYYRELALHGGLLLSREGKILVELASNRSASIDDLFKAAGWKTRIHRDLAGRQRCLEATMNPCSHEGKN